MLATLSKLSDLYFVSLKIYEKATKKRDNSRIYQT